MIFFLFPISVHHPLKIIYLVDASVADHKIALLVNHMGINLFILLFKKKHFIKIFHGKARYQRHALSPISEIIRCFHAQGKKFLVILVPALSNAFSLFHQRRLEISAIFTWRK